MSAELCNVIFIFFFHFQFQLFCVCNVLCRWGHDYVLLCQMSLFCFKSWIKTCKVMLYKIYFVLWVILNLCRYGLEEVNTIQHLILTPWKSMPFLPQISTFGMFRTNSIMWNAVIVRRLANRMSWTNSSNFVLPSPTFYLRLRRFYIPCKNFFSNQ